MIATALGPLEDGLRRAADDVGRPADTDTVCLTRHDQVVLLAGQMCVFVRCASTVVEYAAASLASVLADGTGLRLIRTVRDYIAAPEDPVILALFIRARNVQVFLPRSSESHLDHWMVMTV